MSRRCSVLAVALLVSSSCVGLGAVARVLVVLWPTVSQRVGSTELERIHRPAAPRTDSPRACAEAAPPVAIPSRKKRLRVSAF